MSLCDTCRAPGSCCNGFTLGGGVECDERQAAFVGRPSYADALGLARKNGTPFIPSHPEQIRPGVWQWRYSCPRLTAEGRCGDYENRPLTCRTYRPGQDQLCAEYVDMNQEFGLTKAA